MQYSYNTKKQQQQTQSIITTIHTHQLWKIIRKV